MPKLRRTAFWRSGVAHWKIVHDPGLLHPKAPDSLQTEVAPYGAIARYPGYRCPGATTRDEHPLALLIILHRYLGIAIGPHGDVVRVRHRHDVCAVPACPGDRTAAIPAADFLAGLLPIRHPRRRHPARPRPGGELSRRPRHAAARARPAGFDLRSHFLHARPDRRRPRARP
jgi:hypothetical protein